MLTQRAMWERDQHRTLAIHVDIAAFQVDTLRRGQVKQPSRFKKATIEREIRPQLPLPRRTILAANDGIVRGGSGNAATTRGSHQVKLLHRTRAEPAKGAR
jgi:hypothetical protein